MSIEEFEEWFNNEYPLPPTVERGTVGRDFKKGCEKAYVAGFKALEEENERLKKAGNHLWQSLCDYGELCTPGASEFSPDQEFKDKVLQVWEQALEKNK